MSEKPFPHYLFPGTQVQTTKKNTPDSEWSPEALKNRRWGVKGEIIDAHDSHGICYDVMHVDKSIGCYDPSEFVVI